MADLLSDAAAYLGAVLTEHTQRTVSIQQGSRTYTGINCWCSLTSYDTFDSEGFATSVESWDWRFVAANLPAGFVFRAGDVIAETRNAVERKYEVTQIASKAAVEELDSAGTLIGVHSKRVL